MISVDLYKCKTTIFIDLPLEPRIFSLCFLSQSFALKVNIFVAV